MKHLKASFLFACACFSSIAYSQTYEWARSFGGSENIFSRSISVDKEGNIYVTGEFIGTVDFDPGPDSADLTSNGLRDVFIAKYDWNGEYIWARQIGGTSNDLGIELVVDDLSNIYSIGSFEGTVDFDPGAGVFNYTSIGEDLFLCKLDQDGIFKWAKRIQVVSPDIEETSSIILLHDERPLVVGISEPGEDLLIDNLNISNTYSSQCVYTATFDTDGNVILGKLGTYVAHDIKFEQGSDNNFYSSRELGIFLTLSKSSSQAETGSSKILTFPEEMDLSGMAIDSENNVYILGEFHGSNVHFDLYSDAGVISSTGIDKDVFILKLDSSFTFLWVKMIDGNLPFVVKDITVDSRDNLYVTGGYSGTIKLEGIDLTATNTYTDIFIAKYSKEGGLLWANSFGSTSSDVGQSITLDDYGNLYITGSFRESVDFDPTESVNKLTSSGKADVFLLQYLQCPNPELNIEIAGDTLTAVASDVSYQWLDCDNNYTPVDGAIDQSFIPTKSGHYALQITYGKCADTTSCHEVVVTGLENLNRSFTIYPNPSDGNLNIQFDQLTKTAFIEVIDAMGKVYLSKKVVHVKNVSLTIDASPGIYFIRVVTAMNTKYSRIILQ